MPVRWAAVQLRVEATFFSQCEPTRFVLLGPGAMSDLSPKCARITDITERLLAVSLNEYAPWRPLASRRQKQTVEISMKLFSFWRSLATYHACASRSTSRASCRTRWWT